MSNRFAARTLTFSPELRERWALAQEAAGMSGNELDGLPGRATADAVIARWRTDVPTDPAPDSAPADEPTDRPRPNGRYLEQEILSPNHSRHPNERLHLVLHHCGGHAQTGDRNAGTLSWCLNPASRVSYHVLIAWDGTRTLLVPEQFRAWHAGTSTWRGRSNCNTFTVGIAWGGDTVSGARRPNGSRLLTEPELESGLEWILPRMRHYGWTLEDIITHQMIAPGRRNDTSQAVLHQVRDAVAERL